MNDETHLKNLISAMLDDKLSQEQAKELDHILQNSSEARDTYRRLVDIHFTLNEISENKQTVEFPDLPTPENFPEEFRSTRKQLIIFQTIAALLAIAFIISSVNTKEVIREVEVVKETIPKTVLASVEKVSADATWESNAKKMGDKLYSEELILTKGQVTIKYNHGAEIKLEGPAHYQLKSLELAQLYYGQIAAKVPEAAQGFTVEAPKAAIVDLGTEFALNVTKDGKSQVHVYEGEVVSSLLGDNGDTLVNANLYSKDGVEIDSNTETVTELSGNEKFIRVEEKSTSQLLISSNYVNTVKAHGPLAYWRFENSENSLVKNEMGNTHLGKLTDKAFIENNRFTVNKGDRGAFHVEEHFKEINQKNYTIELWLNAEEHASDMSLISLVLPKPRPNNYLHLFYTQLMSKSGRLRCKPFDFRYSHRYPATKNYGKNAFANESYIPGKWYHMVCVRNDNSFSLYLNGKLKKTLQEKLNNDDLAYVFYMGKIDPMRNMRQFTGQIDEVAIYQKALSDSEIKQHFSLADIK